MINEVLTDGLKLYLGALKEDWNPDKDKDGISQLDIYGDYVDFERFYEDEEGEIASVTVSTVEGDFETASRQKKFDEVIDVSTNPPIFGNKKWYYLKSGTGVKLRVFRDKDRQFDKIMQNFLAEVYIDPQNIDPEKEGEGKIGTANGANSVDEVVGRMSDLSPIEDLVCRRELARLIGKEDYNGMEVEKEALKRIRRKIIKQYAEDEDQSIESIVLANIMIEEMKTLKGEVDEESLEESFRKSCERAWLLYPESVPTDKLNVWMNGEFKEKKEKLNVLYSMLETIDNERKRVKEIKYSGNVGGAASKALDLIREKIRRGFIGSEYKHFEKIRKACDSKEGDPKEKLKSLLGKKLPFYLEALIKNHLDGELEDLDGIVKALEDENLAAKVYHAELRKRGKEKGRVGEPVTYDDFKKVNSDTLEKIRVLVPDYNGKLTEERDDDDNLGSYLLATNKKAKTQMEIKSLLEGSAQIRKDTKDYYNYASGLVKKGVDAVNGLLKGEDPVQEDVKDVLENFVHGEPAKGTNKTGYATTQLEISKNKADKNLKEQGIRNLDLYLRGPQVRRLARSLGAKPTKDSLYTMWEERMIEIKNIAVDKKSQPGWITERREKEFGKSRMNWRKRRSFYASELAEYKRVFDEVCLEPVQI